MRIRKQAFCYTPIGKRDIEHTSKICKAEVGIERLCMVQSTRNPNVQEDSRFSIEIED
jgi:hypothetical protein